MFNYQENDKIGLTLQPKYIKEQGTVILLLYNPAK